MHCIGTAVRNNYAVLGGMLLLVRNVGIASTSEYLSDGAISRPNSADSGSIV